ncbi:MAG: hypothetical protein KDB14_16670 [Planctomycetales bacterium]|nr:hypothetical protein [Planctomycetales bacterium]
MSNIVTWVAFCSVLTAQPAPEPPLESPLQVGLQQATQALGSDNFRERLAASRQLQQAGEEARALLVEAAKSNNLEVRRRAKQILVDFDYGILPDTDRAVATHLRQFRDGDPATSAEAYQWLLSRLDRSTLKKLIALQPINARANLLQQMMNQDNILASFADPDELLRFLRQTLQSDNTQLVDQTASRILFGDKALGRWIAETRLADLERIIRDTPPARRADFLYGFFMSRAVQTLLEDNHFDLVRRVMRLVDNDVDRARLLSRIWYDSRTMTLIVKQENWETLLDEFKDEQATLERLLEGIFRQTDAVRHLLEQRGLADVIKLAGRVDNPESRGRVLARLFANAIVQAEMKKEGKSDLALEAAKQEPDRKARREYIKNLVQSIRYRSNTEPALVSALWELIKQDDDVEWQLTTLTYVVQSNMGAKLLKDEKEMKWVLDLLGTKAGVEHGQNVLRYIIQSSNNLNLALRQGHFALLWSLVRKQDEPNRDSLTQRLLASSELANLLEGKNQLDDLIKLAEEERDQGFRQVALKSLFSNATAMGKFVERSQLGRLQKLVDAFPALQQAELHGALLQANGVTAHLIEKKQHDQLLRFAKPDAEAEVRRQFLLSLFSNTLAMKELIDRGHFDLLHDFAKGEKEESDREMLLSRLYGDTHVMAKFVEEGKAGALLEFAKELEPNEQRAYLQRMFGNEPCIKKLLESNRLDDLLSFVRDTSERYRRASLFGTLISSENLKLIISSGNFPQLVRLLELEADDYARRQMLYYLLGRTDAMPEIVARGHLDGLLSLIRSLEGRTRSELLVRVFNDDKARAQLLKSGELKKVLASGLRDPDPNGREFFRERLFGNSQVLDGMVKAGFFAELEELAASEDDSKRVQYQGTLYLTQSALSALESSGRLRLLLELAVNQPTEQLGTNFYNRLVSSAGAVDLLAKANHFDELVDVAMVAADPLQQGNRVASLLSTNEVLRRIGDGKQVARMFRDVLEHENINVRRRFLMSLGNNQSAAQRVVAYNLTETVIERMQADIDEQQRRHSLCSFLAVPEVAKQQGVAGLDLLFKLIEDETNTYYRTRVISSLAQANTLKEVVAAGRLEPLLQLIEEEANSSTRAWTLRSVLLDDAVLDDAVSRNTVKKLVAWLGNSMIDDLAEAFVGKLASAGRPWLAHRELADEFFEQFETLPESSRASHLTNLMRNSVAKQALIKSSQAPRVLKVLELIPESQRPSQADQLLYSPDGVVAALLVANDVDGAVTLAQQHATSDLGMSRFAALLHVVGRLETQIETLQSKPDRTAAESRLLCHCLRAQGKLDDAFRLASQLGDDGFARSLAVERRDWGAAAELQKRGPCLPPVPLRTTSYSETVQRIEQLGLIANYQYLGGQHSAAAETLKELRELTVADDDHATQWHLAQALLLNGDMETGLALAEKASAEKAYDLLVYRQEYERALRAIGLGEADVAEWLVQQNLSSETDRAFVIQVISLLRSMGEMDRHDQLCVALEQQAGQIADVAQASDLLMRLAGLHLRLGSDEEAWRIVAKVGENVGANHSLKAALTGAFFGVEGADAARAWWNVLRGEAADENFVNQMKRIHRLSQPPQPGDEKWFPGFAERVIAAAEAASGKDSPQVAALRQLAIACQRHGLLDLAERALKAAHAADLSDDYPHWLFQQKRWAEAAQGYREHWERSSTPQVTSLFLSGVCLQNAGQREAGDERIREAEQRVVSSYHRYYLGRGLLERGLTELAMQQFRLVRQMAPAEHWEHNDAARQLGIHLDEGQGVSADWWSIYIQGNLRPNFYFNRVGSNLSIPLLIHKLRAMDAAAAGDVERLRREIEQCQARSLATTVLVEELTPLLRKQQLGEVADELFQRSFDHYTALVERYPGSGLLHNNLAWLCAQADKQLDLALKHAEQAIALSPRNAGHVDTLAEVHFRRGDAAKAVELEERAIAMDPENESLREQLKRFRGIQ